MPVFLAYHEPSAGESCFYGFTTLGHKVEWMRANPQVCVEVDEFTSCTRWRGIVAFGRYEELPDEREGNRHLPTRRATAHHHDVVPDEPSGAAEKLIGYQLLQSHAAWWEPASTARAAVAHYSSDDAFTPVFYKIVIKSVTGLEATPDLSAADSFIGSTIPTGRLDRWRRAWNRICRG